MTVPGGKPVIAVPGATPTSPVTAVAPVLVTAAPPRTAKLPASPKGGAIWARAGLPTVWMNAAAAKAVRHGRWVMSILQLLADRNRTHRARPGPERSLVSRNGRGNKPAARAPGPGHWRAARATT